MHTETKYLKEQIVKMAILVKKILQESIKPDQDKEAIFSIESEINNYHTTIDDIAFKHMALNNPRAKDLRLTIAAMKINTDLERIGDSCVNIKRASKKISSLPENLKNMYDEVLWMYNNALDSLIHQKTRQAFDVIEHDQIVNDYQKIIITSYLKHSQGNNLGIEEVFHILQLTKTLERIGDHTKNIAEDIIFLEKGEDIRHHKDESDGSIKQLKNDTK